MSSKKKRVTCWHRPEAVALACKLPMPWEGTKGPKKKKKKKEEEKESHVSHSKEKAGKNQVTEESVLKLRWAER